MAASKNQRTKKGSTRSSAKRTTSGRKGASGNKNASGGFQTEIILLIILAAAMILVISNLGMGGVVGDTISTVCFGVMGLLAYIFPVILFLGAVFLISNRKNPLAYKKILASVVFFAFLCGLVQLLTEGYMRSTTMADYYTLCSGYRTGGGVIGGAVCISSTSAFGVAGGYIIIIMVLLITLILITQRSFFGFLFKIWDGILAFAHDSHERYMEGQPERELKRELRQQEKRQKREARHAARIQELEAALAEELDEDSEEDIAEEAKFSQVKKKSAKKDRKKGFLEGTNLKFNPEIKSKASKKDEVPEAVVETKEDSRGQLEFEIHRSEPAVETAASVSDDILYSDDTMDDDISVDFSAAEDDVDDHSEHPDPAAGHRTAGEGAKASAADVAEVSGTADGSPESAGEEAAAASHRKNPRSSQKEIESGIRNIQHEIGAKEEQPKRKYYFPPLKLLKRGSGQSKGDSDAHLRKTAQKLQETLHNFGVNVNVTNVSCGPTVTRYELQPEMGVKVSRIVNLADDIKLNLATPDIRIEAPIPGKAAVGIEVPNKENHAVMLRDLIQSQEFQTAKSKLAFAVGKDIGGKPVVADIAKMPHLLIAGATGSGKSVCINTLIISILYKASPEDVKLIMIDPKVVELSVYNGIPHLFIPVVTDPKKAAGALNWAVSEMMSRYNTFAEYNVRNLVEYNRKIEEINVAEGETPPERMPQIVIIVDELADLMMVAPGEVEDAICRLAQLARAAGIHLIIATQRPSVNVITGLIKANMPSRIAFSVSSGVDSRTILDMNGAEKLLGKGDMLFYPQGYQKPARLQGAFVSDEEVSSIVHFLSDKNPGAGYNAQIEQQVNTAVSAGGGAGSEERDVYFEEAGRFIIDKDKASIGMLQRMFKIGFNRAARIMDQLCDAGVVGPEEGTKPRKVLMSMEEFQNYIEETL